VRKSHVFLAGIASATIVLAGAATPALAQTIAGSPLSSIAPNLTGTVATSQICNMGALPLSGEVTSAAAAVTGQSCAGSQTVNQTSNNTSSSTSNGTTQTSHSPVNLSVMGTPLPGLSTVSGAIPGLGSMGNLPLAGQVTSDTQGLTSGLNTPLTNSSNSSNHSSTSNNTTGSTSQNLLSGVTGAVSGTNSSAGQLPGVSTVTGALSGITGGKG